MTTAQNAFTITNPQTGNLAFKIFNFEDNNHFDHLQRNNYYSLIWVREGNGKVKSDFSEYNFEANALLAFSPYQPFMICTPQKIVGVAIYFHPDFYCIHMHQKEVSCNGVLFNNIYQPPFTVIDKASEATLALIVDQIKTEMRQSEMAQYDLLVSYLKIILITASRQNRAAARSDGKPSQRKGAVYTPKPQGRHRTPFQDKAFAKPVCRRAQHYIKSTCQTGQDAFQQDTHRHDFRKNYHRGQA